MKLWHSPNRTVGMLELQKEVFMAGSVSRILELMEKVFSLTQRAISRDVNSERKDLPERLSHSSCFHGYRGSLYIRQVPHPPSSSIHH